MNNGFISNTQPRNSADSMTTTTEGSRFSVSSIELDLFNDLRASSNVKETRAQEIQRKLPDGNKVKRNKLTFLFLLLSVLSSEFNMSVPVCQED